MPSFNTATQMGHATRDAELKYTQSGNAICSFGLAVSKSYKSGDEWKSSVLFLDIKIWGKLGETAASKVLKGDLVLVSGELFCDRWEQDGQKREKWGVTAHAFKKLHRKHKDSPSVGENDNVQGTQDEKIPF